DYPNERFRHSAPPGRGLRASDCLAHTGHRLAPTIVSGHSCLQAAKPCAIYALREMQLPASTLSSRQGSSSSPQVCFKHPGRVPLLSVLLTRLLAGLTLGTHEGRSEGHFSLNSWPVPQFTNLQQICRRADT